MTKSIIGLKEARLRLGNFEFSELGVVRKILFDVVVPTGRSSCSLEMTMQSEERSQNIEVILRFEGVTGLKISDFGGGLTKITGFAIEEVSKDQWEGINWKVFDFEGSRIEFYAENVRIVDAQPITFS